MEHSSQPPSMPFDTDLRTPPEMTPSKYKDFTEYVRQDIREGLNEHHLRPDDDPYQLYYNEGLTAIVNRLAGALRNLTKARNTWERFGDLVPDKKFAEALDLYLGEGTYDKFAEYSNSWFADAANQLEIQSKQRVETLFHMAGLTYEEDRVFNNVKVIVSDHEGNHYVNRAPAEDYINEKEMAAFIDRNLDALIPEHLQEEDNLEDLLGETIEMKAGINQVVLDFPSEYGGPQIARYRVKRTKSDTEKLLKVAFGERRDIFHDAIAEQLVVDPHYILPLTRHLERTSSNAEETNVETKGWYPSYENLEKAGTEKAADVIQSADVQTLKHVQPKYFDHAIPPLSGVWIDRFSPGQMESQLLTPVGDLVYNEYRSHREYKQDKQEDTEKSLEERGLLPAFQLLLEKLTDKAGLRLE